jgi:beta-1,4-mannosyltransferase
MKIAVIPPVVSENPWQRRLYEALEQYGVNVVDGEMKPWWPGRSNGVDLVHLHWVEYLMIGSAPRYPRLRVAVAAVSIIATLLELRRRGIPVVWTLHNPEPHNSPAPDLHRWLNRQVAKLADVVIVHSDYAAAWARSRLSPRAEIVVAPHPNYIGAYPAGAVTARQVRERYHIPEDAFLFLSFGPIQRYKRVPQVLSAFSEVSDRSAHLLVIGYPAHADDVEHVRRLTQTDSRIHADLRPAADDELAALFAAADRTVINYEVFSSGVMMLALSFGCPVVAPAAGAAEGIAGPPACMTFESGKLSEVLAEVLAERRSPTSRAAARIIAESFTPERQARDHMHAYELATHIARGRSI